MIAEHLRIGGRETQEIHDRREALVGMVQHQVVLPDDGEQIAAGDQASGQSGREDRIFQVRPLHQVIDGRQPVEIHRSRHAVHVDIVERELPQQKLRHVLGAVARGLEPYGGSIAPMGELTLQRTAQIVDFLLVDEQVAVACYPELIAAGHLDAGEQFVHEGTHDRREQHQRFCPSRQPGPARRAASERGACTMACSLSRPKASLPSRCTMKLRLLF